MSDFYSLGSGGDNSLPPQPFANYALDYHDLGLAVIPCAGKKGKEAQTTWKQYQKKKPNFGIIKRWIRLFPAANIGLITGRISGITVIDCDNPSFSLEELEAEFGESKFVVSTPSGGKHLYYQYTGESSKTAFRDKIDVKGEGGLIIAPPSFNYEKASFYQVIKGRISDLDNLTSIKFKNPAQKYALEMEIDCTTTRAREIAPRPSEVNKSELRIANGQRNNYLFDQLRRIANNHNNCQSLEDAAFEINTFCFEESLSKQELKRTTKSVWKLKEEGRLITKGEGYVLAKYEAEIVRLRKEPRALILLLELKYHHCKVREIFCIAQDAMSKKLGWSKKSLVRAIEVLIEKKLIFRHKIKNEKRNKTSKIKALAYQYSFYLG